VVGLLPLASGQTCFGMAFPPFLMKHLYCCDSQVIASFVGTGGNTRRSGWCHYEPRKTTEETSRCVRVNKWPNSLTPTWWWQCS
jgi:hypothetical protein